MAALVKLLVLANVVAMVLPLGRCCPAPIVGVSEPTESQATACPNCPPRGGPIRDDRPTPPVAPDACPCCQVRAATAADQALIAPAADLWVPLAATIDQAVAAGFDPRPIEWIQPPGPSLQILHCVWRC